jgi:ABC-type glutathione transport system ATPase component
METVCTADVAYNPNRVLICYYEAIAAMKQPHEVFAERRTKKRADEMTVKGDVVASWHNLSDNERYRAWRVGSDAWVYANSWGENHMVVRVTVDGGDAAERAATLAAEVLQLLPPVETAERGTARVEFWYWAGDGARSRQRNLAVPPWEDIAGNYSALAREEIARLMALTPADIGSGRILLLHGPAGTGKTTAVRAIADAWRRWCDMIYVIDAEEMFGRGGYLMQVLLDQGEDANRWRLIVVEDAEEFLTPDAKANVGQSVARLLNLGDGIIGQGLNVLILMTTNVRIGKLHQAIMRPGRCIANIVVPKLTAAEATEWSEGAVREESTLAELYEAQRHSQIGRGIEHQTIGFAP